MMGSIEERLLAHREVSPSGCWVATYKHAPDGYAYVKIQGSPRLIHRVAYELWVGPIPDGLTIDHVKARGCISRACFNPAHLEAVSMRENIIRGNSANALKTHCPQGHPYEGETLYVWDSWRRCRPCNTEAQRRRREKVRERKAATG